jgi:hypothetical protein
MHSKLSAGQLHASILSLLSSKARAVPGRAGWVLLSRESRSAALHGQR